MSNNATPERTVPHASAYTIEQRMDHIRQHIKWLVMNGHAPRCGHIAATYGGNIITKADVQAEAQRQCELGGSGK